MDIVGACAAQEEVGVRGATVTAQVIKPDIAIVFEGCPADDTCVEQYMVQTAIKRGPMLRHIDARMITNPRYQRYALDLAEKLGIPVQDAVRSAGATNGAAIHLTEKAVPVIVIGVPVRYAHTHYGISAYADFDNAVKLACEILKKTKRDSGFYAGAKMNRNCIKSIFFLRKDNIHPCFKKKYFLILLPNLFIIF